MISFWEFYASFYSALNKLIPYREHTNRLLSYMAFSDGGLYVDIGCGTGILMQNRANMVGIDISRTMLNRAQLTNSNSKFLVADLNDRLPFQDRSFDGAISNNVLAYVRSPNHVLHEIHRVLKPGATFSIATLRPSFNPVVILREHIRRTSHLVIIRYWLPIVIILFLNIPVILNLKLRKYHGFEISPLVNLLRTTGFQVKYTSLSYANQDVLIVATKKC